jgi:hypothetical protein
MKRIIFLILFWISTFPIAAKSTNILDYGAKPDGLTLATVAIQKAINECSQSGGGRVEIPAGTYLTGSIYLKDNVVLSFERNAVLLGSINIKDYLPRKDYLPPSGLIRAEHLFNVGIVGYGVIDGQGWAFWLMEAQRIIHVGFEQKPRPEEPASGCLIKFEDCKNVIVENITLRNSESWTLHLLGCSDVQVKGVTIRNPTYSPTTDGIDIDGSKNVIITGCNIFTRDDGIVIKNRDPDYWNRVCENIAVTNCLITSQASAFKIGTESIGDFRNIVFSNSIIKADTLDKAKILNKEWLKKYIKWLKDSGHSDFMVPQTGIGLMTVDGGHIQSITITNIVIEAEIPLFIRIGNRGQRGLGRGTIAHPSYFDPNALPGTLRDVTISNIIAYNAIRTSSITGIPGYDVENVKLSNITIHTKGGGDSKLAEKILDDDKTIKAYPSGGMWGDIQASGLFMRHVNGIDINDVDILIDEKDMRPLLIMDDIKNVQINNIQTNNLNIGKSILDFVNVKNLRLYNCNIPVSGNTKLLSFKGKDTKDIVVDIPGSQHAEQYIKSDSDVIKGEIFLRNGTYNMIK